MLAQKFWRIPQLSWTVTKATTVIMSYSMRALTDVIMKVRGKTNTAADVVNFAASVRTMTSWILHQAFSGKLSIMSTRGCRWKLRIPRGIRKILDNAKSALIFHSQLRIVRAASAHTCTDFQALQTVQNSFCYILYLAHAKDRRDFFKNIPVLTSRLLGTSFCQTKRKPAKDQLWSDGCVKELTWFTKRLFTLMKASVTGEDMISALKKRLSVYRN